MDFLLKTFTEINTTDVLILAFLTWWIYGIFTQKEKLDQLQKQVNANLQKVYQLNPKLMDAKWLKENTNNIKSLFPTTEVIPAFEHLAPALVAAFTEAEGSKTRQASIAIKAVNFFFIPKE